MKRALVLSLGLFISMSVSQAEDLKAVYERALSNDPQIREADALRLAARESKPQALAALLPQVSGSMSRSKSDNRTEGQFPQEIEQPTGSGNRVVVNFISSSDSEPETDRWSLDVRQCVFSWSAWMNLKRSDRQVEQEEAESAVAL